MELLEELQVVLEHQADVVDAIFQHGDALDADAKGEAGVLIRVDVAVLQNLAVDDAAAQNFDPAGVLAQGAALAVALEAADIDLDAGLGEREVGRAQAGAGVGTEQLLHEGVQGTLQIAQGDALVHDQTFHLVEHGAVGRVGVGTEDAAGDEHLDGRLLRIHGADLAAGGLGAEQELIGQVEGILHIAGGVVLRDVQAGEVVVVILDLRGVRHSKTHAREDVDDLVGDQRQRMQAADRAGLSGQGDVHGLGSVAGGQLGFLHLGGGSIVVRLHLGLQFVDDLAHGGALFRRNGAQILHQRGDLAVFAQIFLPERGQRLLGRDLTEAFFGLFGQLVDHCLHGNSLLLGFLLVQRVTKKLRPALPFGKGDEAVNFTPRYHPVSALFIRSGAQTP